MMDWGHTKCGRPGRAPGQKYPVVSYFTRWNSSGCHGTEDNWAGSLSCQDGTWRAWEGEGWHHRAEDGEHLEASPYGRHRVIPIPRVCTALHRVSQFAFIHIPSCDLHDMVTSSGWASYSHIIEERLFSTQAHKKGKGGHSWEQVPQSSIVHPHTFSLIAIILGWFITWVLHNGLGESRTL